ncbi:MFS general substrate transporter [Sodiomyces alkalinus F11]|uniref:MFS general substrate transporter n=1 Tax=Sodiomyces alkalinus (strain CBS 110278 / VKM F-3762 / F11) TaxID=1314773 RepID=A0A3N2PJX2_SODAK|nr:MFS general substrate transporter [Sodiomyces alkalinus F11]ROT34827.1 MFS general substrate transporter [Sodiomyces alkalinus F11]
MTANVGSQPNLIQSRIIASIAATAISLACGTNYVYSAWAPQFADRLKLTSTESNLVGAAGNLGMYSLGVPIGMFVDHRGPRPAVVCGALLLGLGYFPLHQAYDNATGSVAVLCLFSFLTGLGACMAFAAAVKTSALNWPRHRGTATAFPLAAFGLSAFFFSTLGGLLFPSDTSAFLALLAIGTSGLTFSGVFFLRVVPHSAYYAISQSDQASTEVLHRASEEIMKQHVSRQAPRDFSTEIGTLSNRHDPIIAARNAGYQASIERVVQNEDRGPSLAVSSEPDEMTYLVPNSVTLRGDDSSMQSTIDTDRSPRADIRGFRLIRTFDFWQQFSIMGILAGVGLMTINNTGHNVNALWRHWDNTLSNGFLVSQQQMHVSILSLCSFAGRLLSGIGSDVIVRVLQRSRVWCLFISSLILSVAQICAFNITNPHRLGVVSSLSGLAYGILFGVFPSIVAEAFGVDGLSQNWGYMTLAPVISGNMFNLFYGRVFDQHSSIGTDGERICRAGLACYSEAYFVTLSSCLLGIAATLWVIRRQHIQRSRDSKGTQQD